MSRIATNDIVHSFAFACRHNLPDLPLVIEGSEAHCGRGIQAPQDRSDAAFITPFVIYALRHCVSYIIAFRMATLLSAYARQLSPSDREYALLLMRKYYDTEGRTYRECS